MTLEELFRCRLALALGIPPSEVAELGTSDIDLLSRYWNEEPWGSYRDNLHAAIIAREVRSTAFKGKHLLDTFMVKFSKPEDKKGAGWSREQVFGMFRALAGGIRQKRKG